MAGIRPSENDAKAVAAQLQRLEQERREHLVKQYALSELGDENDG